MGLQTTCGVAINIFSSNIMHVPSHHKAQVVELTSRHYHQIVFVLSHPVNSAHNIQVMNLKQTLGFTNSFFQQ